MSSQVRASALRGQICVRTSGVEDFGPAAGQAAQPRRHQLLQDGRTGRLAVWAKRSISTAVQAFRCRRGKAACRSRVMPRYQSNSCRGCTPPTMCSSVQPASAASLAAGEDFGRRHRVGPRIVLVAAVGAQRAAIDADVGGIDVQIEVVVGRVAILAAADQIGQLAHGVQIGLGREQDTRRRPPRGAGRTATFAEICIEHRDCDIVCQGV